MTLSALHSQMALIDLRIMISQDQLTFLTEKQYTIMDVSSNLDSMVFGAQNNPDAEFAVDMGQVDPTQAADVAAGRVPAGNWVPMVRNATTGAFTPGAGIAHTAVTYDPASGGYFATVAGQRQMVFRQVPADPATGRGAYYASGRHTWMRKADAVSHLTGTRNRIKKEEYKDQQAVKKIQTQLEMLMKQKDQVLGWLKKRLEDWFKGVGDQR